MKLKQTLAVLALSLSHAAVAALSSETAILAPPTGNNADWGQLHAAAVTLNWAWPAGVTSGQLSIVANGQVHVLDLVLDDKTVSSYVWACGVPTQDTLYDVTLTFDGDEVQTAQLVALRGSFDLGVPVRGWDSSGAANVKPGTVVPYRASWGVGLAGPATLAVGTEVTGLPHSDGYLSLKPTLGGRRLATLDFETEPASPAFSTYLNLGRRGFAMILR